VPLGLIDPEVTLRRKTSKLTKMRATILLLVLAIARGLAESITVTANSGGGTQAFTTNFVPKSCADLTTTDLAHLTSSEVTTMVSAINSAMGASTICVALWGHVVASNIPDANNYVNTDWVKLYANIVANIMDRDGNGVVDDLAIELNMRTKAGGHYTIARATSMTDDQENGLTASMGSSTAIKQDEDFDSEATINTSVGSATEEIFHTYQHALGQAHPTIFGSTDTGSGCEPDRRQGELEPIGHRLKKSAPELGFLDRRIGDECGSGAQANCDWTGSKLLKCGAAAMCNWYSNQLCCSATGASASKAQLTGGDCASPSCAGIEWYFDLMFSYLGQSWYDGDKGYPNGLVTLSGGVAFPMGKSAVETMLNGAGADCVDFLAAMKSADYYQLTSPITYTYTATPVASTTTSAPTPPPTSANSGIRTTFMSVSCTLAVLLGLWLVA